MQFIVTVVIFVLASKYCKEYIALMDNRHGPHLMDPILSLYKSKDFSFEIFIIFHSMLFLSFLSLLKYPKELMVAFQAYALLMVFRTISIYVVPLQAPADMIFLKDPFADRYMHTHGAVVNDLFFSGHVSSSVLFYLVAVGKKLKRVLISFTLFVAVLILWQKVHYTVDVIFAPFFAFAAVRIISYANEKIEQAHLSNIFQKEKTNS